MRNGGAPPPCRSQPSTPLGRRSGDRSPHPAVEPLLGPSDRLRLRWGRYLRKYPARTCDRLGGGQKPGLVLAFCEDGFDEAVGTDRPGSFQHARPNLGRAIAVASSTTRMRPSTPICAAASLTYRSSSPSLSICWRRTRIGLNTVGGEGEPPPRQSAESVREPLPPRRPLRRWRRYSPTTMPLRGKGSTVSVLTVQGRA